MKRIFNVDVFTGIPNVIRTGEKTPVSAAHGWEKKETEGLRSRRELIWGVNVGIIVISDIRNNPDNKADCYRSLTVSWKPLPIVFFLVCDRFS